MNIMSIRSARQIHHPMHHPMHHHGGESSHLGGWGVAGPRRGRLYYVLMAESPHHEDDDSTAAPRAPGQRRVLIVRPSALGDVSRTVPALVTLRRALPEARIDWLVAEPFADVVRHHPMLDGIVSFARDRLARFGLTPAATRQGLALYRELRQGRYDTVYDLQGLLRSGLLTRLTGAGRRVGFADAREGGWLGYNVRHRVQATHTVDRMLGLLEADGLDPVRDMQLYIGPDERDWLARFRRETGIADADYACLAPTARWRCKCWPLESYAEIARRLLETSIAGAHLVLIASPHEQHHLAPLLDALPEPLRRRVHLPTTTVGQMMALLSQTRLLVCNDSAALHIAVGFERPIVAVFGPTDPARVGPYQRADTVVQPPGITPDDVRRYRRYKTDQSLIGRIDVDRVWRSVEQQLDRRRNGADSTAAARAES